MLTEPQIYETETPEQARIGLSCWQGKSVGQLEEYYGNFSCASLIIVTLYRVYAIVCVSARLRVFVFVCQCVCMRACLLT